MTNTDDSTGPARRAVDVLLIEDSATDVKLTRMALERALNLRSFTIATDGDVALDMLRRKAGFEGCPRPDLIFLDLNLPRKSGFDVLSEIRDDPRLRMIPVIVLTTSDSESDVARAYGALANCFITKPMDIERFFAIARSIAEFWTDKARLPPKSAAGL